MIKLGHLYPQVETEWASLLRHPFWSYNVPTEFVITEPQALEPIKARCYRTRLYWFNKRAMDYQELRLERRGTFRGTAYEEEVCLVEVWDDYGDDGHTRYYHIGWRFVPHITLEICDIDCQGKKHPLPEPMRRQSWDESPKMLYG